MKTALFVGWNRKGWIFKPAIWCAKNATVIYWSVWMKETSTKYGFHRKNEENWAGCLHVFQCIISCLRFICFMAWYLKSIPKKSSQKNPFRRENISNECPYNVLKIHPAGFPWISHIIYLFIYLFIYIYINPINYPIRIIPESFHD